MNDAAIAVLDMDLRSPFEPLAHPSVRDLVERVDCYALPGLDLERYRGLVVEGMIDQEFLYCHRGLVGAYLDRGGTAVFGGHLLRRCSRARACSSRSRSRRSRTTRCGSCPTTRSSTARTRAISPTGVASRGSLPAATILRRRERSRSPSWPAGSRSSTWTSTRRPGGSSCSPATGCSATHRGKQRQRLGPQLLAWVTGGNGR